MDRSQAAHRLNNISIELRASYVACGDLVATESSARNETLKTALAAGKSVSEADRRATINSSAISQRVLKKKGEILALEEERDHIRFMVKYGEEGELTNGNGIA